MKKVSNSLRVVHFPQVGACTSAFTVGVTDEEQACFVMGVLANQHLWLADHNIIPDYSNAIYVEMYNERAQAWEDYFNEDEMMEWEEFEDTYLRT